MGRLTIIGPALCTLVLLLGTAGDSAAVLYRWVDENNVVHYTDTLPPDSVEKARTEYSRSGLPVNRVPRAKTPEEIRQEQELERLRTEQRELIEELHSIDRVLLRTFRSEDDLLRARDSKFATIDLMIQVSESNITRQKRWLAELRTDAANLERSGRPVPEHLQKTIRKTEDSIREGQEAISRRDEQKEAIRASFEQDLRRFKQLRTGGAKTGKTLYRPLRPVLHEIVLCGDDAECDSFWHRAAEYLGAESAFEVQTGEGNDIVVISPWGRRNKPNLILARIADAKGPGASLFLELQCPTSLRRRDTCQDPELTELAKGFRAAVAPPERADERE